MSDFNRGACGYADNAAVMTAMRDRLCRDSQAQIERMSRLLFGRATQRSPAPDDMNGLSAPSEEVAR